LHFASEFRQDELEYDELLAMSEIKPDLNEMMFGGGIENPLVHIKQALDPGDKQDWQQFLEFRFCNRRVDDAFARGFIAGVQEFFEQVKDKL
jgi:hypothetical protein